MDYAALYGWVYANVPGYGAGHGTPALPLCAELLSDGGVLVDVGCGRQQFCAALRPMAPLASLYGLDVVRVEPVPDGVEFVRAPAWDLSRVPSPDVVTSFDVLEHLHPDDVRPTLTEWAERMRPGGYVVATICTRPSQILGPEGVNLHPTVRSEDWWLNEFRRLFVHARIQGGLFVACKA